MRNRTWGWVVAGASLGVLLFCTNLFAQTNTFPSSGSVGIEGNLVVGFPGNDYGTEFLPNTSGNSIFWIDNYNNQLRFSNGNSPGSYPMVLNNGGYLGLGTLTPDANVDVAGISRFELTTSSVIMSPLMNAGNINDVVRINAPYSANPAGGSNAGADRKSTRLNSSHVIPSRMPSSA